jgi:sialate O-acetylesterase
LEADPQYRELLEKWDHDCATFDMEKAKAAYKVQREKWQKVAAAAKAAGKAAPQPPRAPGDIRVGQHRPANCYNGMLLPLEPFAIRGAIWYQGETNTGRAYQYRSLFPLMIKNWREDWRQGDFPFYFVQLANFMAVKPQPVDSAWAELREAQTMTLKVPHTGQAVIIDIGDAANIHPKDKQDVGKRLALWALAKDYGRDLADQYSSPMYKSMTCKGNQIAIHFDFVGGGLVAKDAAEVKGFAIAGADKKFVWANAKIVGKTVVVSSPAVARPLAVRYAWADNPVCNLYSEDGLPVCPFRTDTWPGLTAHTSK